jgi:4-carboxymuconolactone decarboxylase
MTAPRLPRLTPAELNAEQAELYDRIAGGERATGTQAFALVGSDGALEGPFNAFLYQTDIGGVLEALGAAIRYRTSFTAREREIAILLTANQRDSEFERYAHEAIAQLIGMTDAEIKALRRLDVDSWQDERERVIAQTALRLLVSSDLNDEEYVRATSVLDESQIVELTALVGHYSTLALQMKVFRVRS